MEKWLFGWISVLISCFAFGSFAVPIKSPRVRAVGMHPLAFQVQALSGCMLSVAVCASLGVVLPP